MSENEKREKKLGLVGSIALLIGIIFLILSIACGGFGANPDFFYIAVPWAVTTFFVFLSWCAESPSARSNIALTGMALGMIIVIARLIQVA